MSDIKYKNIRRPIFDKDEKLADTLYVVWVGDKCGIYDYRTDKFVLELVCVEISQHYSFYRLFKDTGETGLFDPSTKEVSWDSYSKQA